MMLLKLIASLFLIVAIVCFLNLTPQGIADDLMRTASKKTGLRKQAHDLRSGKKKKSLGKRLLYMQNAMTAMGKGGKFALVICGSLVLLAAGAVLAIILNNVYLIPAFAAAFAILPFVYMRNTISLYDRHIKEEMETTLSVISTSYVRNEDIIAAVKENLPYIKPPLREHFSAFLTDATLVSNTKQAIVNLSRKVDDAIFREWCEALMQCEDDRSLKDTLQPVVDKLKDVRIVNSELSAMMASVRMEYYTMVGLVIGNIPLLYLLNKDWFHSLVFETAGKITLGVCGLVILVTYLFMLKFTKPVEFKG